jgi:hypothetical protein
MAAVTQANVAQRHVWGDSVVRFYTISGASGSTLQTGAVGLLFVGVQPGSLITAVANSVVAGLGVQLTFTSSAPMVNEVVMVVSRNG